MGKVGLFIVASLFCFGNLKAEEIGVTLNSASKKTNVVRNPSSSDSSLSQDKAKELQSLNAELKESEAKAKLAGQEMRPEEFKKEHNRKRKVRRIISGPTETVDVPDGVDWDHNRKNQEDNASILSERANQDLSPPSED